MKEMKAVLKYPFVCVILGFSLNFSDPYYELLAWFTIAIIKLKCSDKSITQTKTKIQIY